MRLRVFGYELGCWIGTHSWRIAREIHVAGSGYVEHPMDFELGGVDYEIKCAHCPKTWVIKKRGAWMKPNYPPLGN